MRELVDRRLDVICSDRTAHQLRLERLLPQLARRFEGRRSAGEIRACADAVLARYDEVPIRLHLLTIAHRQTSECLSAERCDVLAAS